MYSRLDQLMGQEKAYEDAAKVEVIKLKGYMCLTCQSGTKPFVSKLCREQQHAIKGPFATSKRCFGCRKCKRRTIMYGLDMPTQLCRHCEEWAWEPKPFVHVRRIRPCHRLHAPTRFLLVMRCNEMQCPAEVFACMSG